MLMRPQSNQSNLQLSATERVRGRFVQAIRHLFIRGAGRGAAGRRFSFWQWTGVPGLIDGTGPSLAFYFSIVAAAELLVESVCWMIVIQVVAV